MLTFACISSVSFLPESVRWQISVGRYEKAEKTLAKIAEANKKPNAGPFFDSEFQKEQVRGFQYEISQWHIRNSLSQGVDGG